MCLFIQVLYVMYGDFSMHFIFKSFLFFLFLYLHQYLMRKIERKFRGVYCSIDFESLPISFFFAHHTSIFCPFYFFLLFPSFFPFFYFPPPFLLFFFFFPLFLPFFSPLLESFPICFDIGGEYRTLYN